MLNRYQNRAVRQIADELQEIRKLNKDFTPPGDAPDPLIAFYRALASFDLDMQRHIDIENTVLFPCTLPWEKKLVPQEIGTSATRDGSGQVSANHDKLKLVWRHENAILS